MNKILYFLIITSVLISPLQAKKPTLAKVESIHSNAEQRLSVNKYEFICKPYGIITIDELFLEAKISSTCRISIDSFYRQNPRKRFFSESILKRGQYYHVEFKKERCIIYAKGLNTLSELLLREGLAVKKTTFKDEEFDYSFQDAQIDAQENNIGMHKNKIKYKCIAELFALEQKERK